MKILIFLCNEKKICLIINYLFINYLLVFNRVTFIAITRYIIIIRS